MGTEDADSSILGVLKAVVSGWDSGVVTTWDMYPLRYSKELKYVETLELLSTRFN